MSEETIVKLKSDGDLVEQQFADRIAAVIPSYAKVWAEYIGNDGHAHALPMAGVEREVLDSREKQWQRIYTILESLALCWEIEDDLHKITEITGFRSYAQNLNLWMAFHSHMGRIHDMVKAVAGELDRPDLLKPFDEYWKDRHIVLHGPKVPMKWVYNALAVPALGETPKHWNDKMLWQELKSTDFEFVSTGVSKILRELEARLEQCFADLRKSMPAKHGWRPVSWNAAVKNLNYDVTKQVRANLSVSSSGQLSSAEFIIGSGTGTNISGAEDG